MTPEQIMAKSLRLRGIDDPERLVRWMRATLRDYGWTLHRLDDYENKDWIHDPDNCPHWGEHEFCGECHRILNGDEKRPGCTDGCGWLIEVPVESDSPEGEVS